MIGPGACASDPELSVALRRRKEALMKSINVETIDPWLFRYIVIRIGVVDVGRWMMDC
jgi:hypothetical protein